jgi:TonB family protein
MTNLLVPADAEPYPLYRMRHLLWTLLSLWVGGCAPRTQYYFRPPRVAAGQSGGSRWVRINQEPSQDPASDLARRARATQVPGLDGKIQVLYSKLPVYLLSARLAGVEGIVEVAFVVNENGVVSEAAVTRSAHEWLDDECLKCIKKWRFAPMTSGGRPTKVRLIQRFPFVLRLAR